MLVRLAGFAAYAQTDTCSYVHNTCSVTVHAAGIQAGRLRVKQTGKQAERQADRQACRTNRQVENEQGDRQAGI